MKSPNTMEKDLGVLSGYPSLYPRPQTAGFYGGFDKTRESLAHATPNLPGDLHAIICDSGFLAQVDEATVP